MKSALESLRHPARALRALLASLAVAACALPAAAVELEGAPSAKVTDEGVQLQWTTDGLCGTRVAYGVNADQLNRKAEGGLGLFHSATLGELKPDTTYHFTLGTSKHWLAKGTLTLDSGGTVTLRSDAGDATTSPPAVKTAETPEPTGKRTSRPLPKLEEPAPPKPPATPAAKPAPAKITAPPTHKTWGYMDSLQDHYDRHGKDFRCTSPDDYAAKAWMFLQYARQNGLPMKWDASDGTLRVWEPKSRAFAAYNRNGTTKTFFRPNSDSYWGRQPGRPIRASELPF